jgi:hypothetical protein
MRSGGIAPLLLTSAPDGCEWSGSYIDRFIPKETAPVTHFSGGWVSPRAGINVVKIINYEEY